MNSWDNFLDGLDIIYGWFTEKLSGWDDFLSGVFSGEFNYEDGYTYIINSAQGIPFAIPEQIFVAIDSLTRVVGYIMPLRLYMPIIVLILGYWLILIMFNVLKATFNIFNGVFFGIKK